MGKSNLSRKTRNARKQQKRRKNKKLRALMKDGPVKPNPVKELSSNESIEQSESKKDSLLSLNHSQEQNARVSNLLDGNIQTQDAPAIRPAFFFHGYAPLVWRMPETEDTMPQQVRLLDEKQDPQVSSYQGTNQGTDQSADQRTNQDSNLSSLEPINTWSVYKVCKFITQLLRTYEYSDAFALHEIDGAALVLLNEDHLVRVMKMKLGPAIKVLAKVQSLMNSNS